MPPSRDQIWFRRLGMTGSSLLPAKNRGYQASSSLTTRACCPSISEPRPLGRWNEALPAAEQVRETVKAGSIATEAELVRGCALIHLGEYSAARAALSRLAADESTVASGTRVAIHWLVGEAFFHEGQFERAITAYDMVLAEDAPDSWKAAALLQTGKCAEQLGNNRQADQVFERIEREYGDSPWAAEAQRRRAATAPSAQTSAAIHASISPSRPMP